MKRLNGSDFVLGSSEDILKDYEEEQIHLIWTSPPYFQQRPEYATYEDLRTYLQEMSKIFIQCGRILKSGYCFVVNIGQDRQFDLPAKISQLLEDIGLDYVDTICWNKGGEIGMRGAFLEKQMYYPNFSWEPILVYRKPPRDYGAGVKGGEDFPKYDFSDIPYITANLRKNVWDVTPEKNSFHPAAFPIMLAKNVIRCYTSKGQYVLDPFGGSGTTARAAIELHREYLLVERSEEYYKKAVSSLSSVTMDLGL